MKEVSAYDLVELAKSVQEKWMLKKMPLSKLTLIPKIQVLKIMNKAVYMIFEKSEEEKENQTQNKVNHEIVV